MSSTKFVFFRADQKTKMVDLASDWLRHFQLLLCNCRTEFKETWQEASTQCPLPNLCFSRLIRKPRWPPWPLIGWDVFDFYATAEWNSIKLDKISRSSTRFVFFIPIRKPRWPPPPWPLAETFFTSSLHYLITQSSFEFFCCRTRTSNTTRRFRQVKVTDIDVPWWSRRRCRTVSRTRRAARKHSMDMPDSACK